MPAIYRFGPFELHPTRQQLLQDGRPVVLGQRAFDLLLALTERAGQLVPKDDLLGLVWPGLVVEENNLQVQVSALRKILGQAAIATVAGRGYRLTLDIAPAGTLSPPAVGRRHNLPPHLTSFIGHDDDLDDYSALLEQTRLLTLTGIGGCGKTRLAVKLAERVLPSFPDGVWYVDLAPLTDPQRVPLTVATTLQIPTQVDQFRIETMCEHLASRRMLLVLDNCEHLATACAELTEKLLGSTAGVRVLATSREGLNVPGEWTVTVRSLALPAIGSEGDLAALASNEAVRLFVERAQMAGTRFALDETTAAAVAEICRRLDGIPLAIELAAARVKVLSVEEIRTRLNDRFRLLTSGRTASLARQQTLLAVIRWSYDHLAPDEQRVLRLLSVFVGGWTLAGAVRVAGKAGDDYDVLDVLTRLVDRSLVIVERFADGRSRYAMLETVRQYAQERLNESGEGDAAHTRHLEFYLALAEEEDRMQSGREHGARLVQLKAELENLLQALAWCDYAEVGAETGLRLAHALLDFWVHAGLTHLGHQEIQTALGRPNASTRSQTRAMALDDAAFLACGLGRYVEAKAQAAEALSIARDIGDSRLAAEATMTLAYLASEDGDNASALEYLNPALGFARETQDDALTMNLLNSTGEAQRAAGNLEAAQPLYEEALALAREQKKATMIAKIGDNLARVFIPRGMPERAQQLLLEVFAIALDAGSKWVALCALDITAVLAAMARDWTFAARMRGAAEARVKNMKHKRDRGDEAFLAPWTAQMRAVLGEAGYVDAFDSGFVLSHEEAAAEAVAWLGSKPHVTVERDSGVAMPS